MKFQYILSLFFLFAFGTASAQNQDNLMIEASMRDSSVIINWMPTNAKLWEEGLQSGYRVVRHETFDYYETESEDEEVTGKTLKTYIVDTIDMSPVGIGAFLPADTTWYAEHQYDADGYIKVMGMMMHDTIFNVGKDGGTNREEKYEYVQFGSRFYPELMGKGLGLGFVDNTTDLTKTYIYEVSMIDRPEISQRFELSFDQRYVKQPEDFYLNFDNVPFAKRTTPSPVLYELVTSGKGFQDSIILRWAPLSPRGMRGSKEMGYRILKSKKKESTGDFVVVDTLQIMPWDSLQYDNYVNSSPNADDMVMVAAQFMFGDNTSEAPSAVEKGDMMTSMHGYALYAAELSANTANALGIRYVDYDVEPDVEYNYQIYMPIDSIDRNAFSYPSDVQITNTYVPPLPLINVDVSQQEYAIAIGLDRENQDNYSFFFFERSDDGGRTYQPLHNNALSFEIDEEMDESINSFAYVDSVAVLYRTYHYRFRGLNTFGEYSPWKLVKGMAVDLTPPPAPLLNEPIQIDKTTAEITWVNDYVEVTPDLEGYIVNICKDNDTEGGVPISGLLPKGTTQFLYKDTFRTDKSYFFQVAAVDTAGNQSVSFPYFMNVIDSIAPAIPVNLTGLIDSVGIATIAWEQVTDKDLAGYRVYYSNDPYSEFVQISSENQIYNFFQDTVQLKTLTEKIYYKVASIDERHNISDYSETLVLERPDIVPPVAPLLLQPEASGDGITLNWRASSSDDVDFYFLYRRAVGDTTDWVILDSLGADQITYADTTAEYEQLLEYTIRAKDDASNWSTYATALSGRRFFDKPISGISTLAANFVEADNKVEIQWNFQKPAIDLLKEADYRYMIFRGEAEKPLQRYKQLKSKDPVYIDKQIKENQTYRYAMMVVYENGKKSDLSDEVVVIIPKKED